MKAIFSAVALAAVAASSLAAWAATAEDHQEQMKKCAVCKYMAEEPELMSSMTWECHKVDSGMLCVASVPKDMKKKYDEVHKKMLAAIEKVKEDTAAGRSVELCDFCSSMAGLHKAGAKEETIETSTGSIYLVTSKDSAVVDKIHTQADQQIAEQEAASRQRN